MHLSMEWIAALFFLTIWGRSCSAYVTTFPTFQQKAWMLPSNQLFRGSTSIDHREEKLLQKSNSCLQKCWSNNLDLHPNWFARTTPIHMIGTGFTFEDAEGDQILVSAQKPLGMILEEVCNDDKSQVSVFVAELSPGGSADRAGVQVGDIILAVQNADCINCSLEQVMDRIIKAPKVVNLRFSR